LFLSFHSYCRSAKADLRMATAKVEEMTKLMQNVQDQMQRRVGSNRASSSLP
jgi:hypothetical protein